MAGTITDSVLEEIKARTDLAELVASYGIQVRQSGASTVACCPFHNEKTPSFNINSAKGFYHCFGCGESGDAIKFVEKQEGLTFIEAVKKLAGMCGVEIKEEEDPEANLRKRLLSLMTELALFYHRCLEKMKGAQIARDYLASRALGEDVQKDFLIGYAPEGMKPMVEWAKKYGYTLKEMEEAGVIKAPTSPTDRGYSRFGGRLMFAIRDKNGRVVAFSGRQLVENKKSGKYVNSPETAIFKKSNILYAFDKAAGNIAKSKGREAIICEGQIDCIRLHISGFPVAVASQGTAFTEEHAKMLSRVADCAILAFDDDAAGHKATIRTARLLLQAGMPVRAARIPGGEDPDSFLRKYGKEEFEKILSSAESIIGFQFRAESQKEATPRSIDAVARISKALIETIAFSPNAVLRASMVAEAAKFLELPQIALNEELNKALAAPKQNFKNQKIAKPAIEEGDEDLDSYEIEESEFSSIHIEGKEARKIIPPPKGEISLIALILSNPEDDILFEMTSHFLDARMLEHDFTKKILGAWLGAPEGQREEEIEKLEEEFSDEEKSWRDSAMVDSLKLQACGLSLSVIGQNLIRALWRAYLGRKRGAMNANAQDESEFIAFAQITSSLRTLQQDRWAKVKELVLELKKGLT
ncbi:MAG: DNA primase [Kiritimatiellae bacterium]|nr:DNA primase [Kiritimatiellia bacterium]